MWRTAIYARETTGGGRHALERQVATLVAQVARQAGWHHVATQGLGKVSVCVADLN